MTQWRRGVSVGEALARARGQAGLSVAQVSQRTCIRETIIRGIERDDFSACGGDFYARGHIRSIARTVGADPDALIHDYDLDHGMAQPITAAEVFEPATPIKLKERRRSPNWTVAMAVVLVLLVGFGVYRAVSGHAPSRPVAANRPAPSHPHPRPSASATHSLAPSTDATGHHLVIQVTALEDCWVQFTRNNRYLSQDYVFAGTSKTWHFKRGVTMQIGNPGGIVLTVNGKKLGHPNNSGGPVVLSFGPKSETGSSTG